MIWRTTMATAHRKRIAFIALGIPTGRGKQGGKLGRGRTLPAVYHRPRRSGRSPASRVPTGDTSPVGPCPILRAGLYSLPQARAYANLPHQLRGFGSGTHKAINAIHLPLSQSSRSVVRTFDCGSRRSQRGTLVGVSSILFADLGVVSSADNGSRSTDSIRNGNECRRF
jgi:hypothetical protein